MSCSCTSGSASTSASSLRAPTRGIGSTTPISDEASISAAEQSSAVSTPASIGEMAPAPAPIAMPPAIEAWNAASERPATQRGAESCTPILNSATASIQTEPATTSAAAVSTGLRLNPIAMIAPPIDSAQARTADSPLSRLRISPILSAPITAPMPKAPSMMP